MAGKNAGGELNGRQKAAIFLVAMGPEKSAEILKQMSTKEVDELIVEMSQLGMIPRQVKEKVITEFNRAKGEHKGSAAGGTKYARMVLDETFGKADSESTWNRLSKSVRQAPPFDMLKRINPQQVLTFVKKEQPQTVALILSYLGAEQSSVILSSLPPDKQVDVIMRIATIDQTDPEIIDQIETVLQRQISSNADQSASDVGGVKTVAEMLNRVDRSTEKNLLETLEKQNAELSDDIKRLMFVFEDIVLVEDRSMQQILKEVDSKEIALALKAASEEVKSKFFDNMSKRAGEMIAEEMEFMGPVRLKDVEESQQRVVNVVRRLEEEGSIIISGRGGAGNELIV